MSRIQPQTVVLNAKAQLDRQGHPIMGIVQPLKTAAGKHVGSSMLLARPLFDMPAPLGIVSHWINEAAKRRCGGDMSKAKPSELVQVPVYRGTSARFYNEIRCRLRRKRRAMTMTQRIKHEIVSRFAKQKPVEEVMAS